MQLPRTFRLADGLLMLAVALASALLFRLFFAPSGAVTAVVTVGQKEIARIDLSSVSESSVIRPDTDPPVVILVEPGAVSFSEAGCPDRVCVRTGKLTKPGQSAVCLPARVSVRLEGSSGVDAEVY